MKDVVQWRTSYNEDVGEGIVEWKISYNEDTGRRPNVATNPVTRVGKGGVNKKEHFLVSAAVYKQ